MRLPREAAERLYISAVAVLLAFFYQDRYLDSPPSIIAVAIRTISIFWVSQAVFIKFRLNGLPNDNTTLLLLTGLVSGIFGAAVAASLMIQPMIFANRWRAERRHLYIFSVLMIAVMADIFSPFISPYPFNNDKWIISIFCSVALATGFFFLDHHIVKREDGDLLKEALNIGYPAKSVQISGVSGLITVLIISAGAALTPYVSIGSSTLVLLLYEIIQSRPRDDQQ